MYLDQNMLNLWNFCLKPVLELGALILLFGHLDS